MDINVKIAVNLKHKILGKAMPEVNSLLFGFIVKNEYIITDIVNTTILEEKEFSKIVNLALSFFPVGICMLGYFTFQSDLKSSDFNTDKNDHPLILYALDENKILGKIWKESKFSESFEAEFVSNLCVMQKILDNFYIFFVEETFTCRVPDNISRKDGIKHGIAEIKDKIYEEKMCFIHKGVDLFMISLEDKTTLEEKLGNTDNFKVKKITQKDISTIEIMEIFSEHMIGLSPFFEPKSQKYAPVLTITPCKLSVFKVKFSLKSFALCRKESTCSSACNLLTSCLLRQLDNMKLCLTCNLLKVNTTKTTNPENLHFCSGSSIITTSYFSDMSDDDLEQFRRNFLHKLFLEPRVIPLYTRLNAVQLPLKKSSYLTNPHVGIKNPVLEGGEIYLCDGSYSYHHYMQDRMDDNGWGCAYRSLQTLVSWFRHQGYTNKAVPNHRQIQEILVKLEDKPKKFVGSRLWIGSIEVNNVLNEYLGITSKIMTLSKGSEMESNGRELARHFETNGTPIMIGGGVLAHTIVGICFSKLTGETRFLIVDPHYTGLEDLKVIQNKGWCGWKDNNFWDPNAFYNLCLPQRPKVI